MEDLLLILEELNIKYKQSEENISDLESKLSDYKQELEILRKKYNVDIIESEIRNEKSLNTKTSNKIFKVKFKYISDIIYNVLQENIFKDKNERKVFFKWLYENYKIKYDAYYDYIEFDTFYNSYIEGSYKAVELEENNIGCYIKAEFYFRGDLDDKVEFSIPFNVLNDFDNFEKNVKEYFDLRQKEIEKEKEEKNAKKEQAEYELFLKLKGKFEK